MITPALCVIPSTGKVRVWFKKVFLLLLVIISIALPCVAQSDVESTRKAAEQGDASAQRKLGVMYCDGQGVA